MAKVEPVGLYLIVEAMPGEAVLERVKAALSAGAFASALVTAPPGKGLDAQSARPFIELIQCNEDGLWGAQHGEGLHHVGSQFDGVVDKVAGLVADGHTVDARISFPGGDIAAVYMGTGHPHVHNTRLELMTPRRPDGGPA